MIQNRSIKGLFTRSMLGTLFFVVFVSFVVVVVVVVCFGCSYLQSELFRY